MAILKIREFSNLYQYYHVNAFIAVYLDFILVINLFGLLYHTMKSIFIKVKPVNFCILG